jgi:hypothetical protein
MKVSGITLFSLIIVLASSPSSAQDATGRVIGTTSDQQGAVLHLSPVGCEVVCGGPAGFALNHRPGIASHRDAEPVFEAGRMVQDQAASAVAWVVSASRSFLGYLVQKCLPLFARQEFEEP